MTRSLLANGFDDIILRKMTYRGILSMPIWLPLTTTLADPWSNQKALGHTLQISVISFLIILFMWWLMVLTLPFGRTIGLEPLPSSWLVLDRPHFTLTGQKEASISVGTLTLKLGTLDWDANLMKLRSSSGLECLHWFCLQISLWVMTLGIGI